VPVFGALIEKNILARTMRTLGTLVSSGVPILEALNITRETAGNALFERIFSKVIEAIREGEVISKPLQAHAVPGFQPWALFFWMLMGSFPGVMIISVALTSAKGTGTKGAMETLLMIGGVTCGLGAVMCALFYMMKRKSRVIDELVVNMVDVGEETG